jgi:hypothetical protein
MINFPVRLLAGCDQKCAEAAMGDVFGNQNFEPDQLNEAINSAENFLYTRENLDFAGQVDQSFLPEIVRLCKVNQIRLVLMRTKILRFSKSNPEPSALVKYINDLDSYAQDNSLLLIDFAHDPRLPADAFQDTHHLNQRGKEIFTGMLVQALRTIPLP